MISISDRINMLMDLHGIKAIDLCKATDLNKSSISRLLNGETMPNSDTLYKISKYFNVSMEYLFTGEEHGCPETTISKDEQELLELFHKLNTYDRSEIIGIINLKLSSQKRDSSSTYQTTKNQIETA